MNDGVLFPYRGRGRLLSFSNCWSIYYVLLLWNKCGCHYILLINTDDLSIIKMEYWNWHHTLKACTTLETYCLQTGHSASWRPHLTHVSMCPHSSNTQSTGASIHTLHRKSPSTAGHGERWHQIYTKNKLSTSPVCITWLTTVSHCSNLCLHNCKQKVNEMPWSLASGSLEGSRKKWGFGGKWSHTIDY